MDFHTTPLSQTPDKEGHKMPMLTPKNSDGSQRVIKRIMFIDPKKLRVAGLDLKMAEALKKAKSKVSNTSNSKDTKLALAKSIVSKKIRQAQLSKESKQTQNVTSQELSKSSQDTELTPSLPSTTPPKPQIKVANLKTLMPPPPAPVMTQPQTVLLNFIKSNNTSSDSNKRNTAEQIPKASTKKLNAQQKLQPQPKTYASKVLSSEVKFEMKKPKEVESVAPKIIEVKILSPTKETFTASPHKHRPKVLESKVLSPEEKIDLRTLRVNDPSILLPLVSSANLQIDNNNSTSDGGAKKTPPMKHPPKEIPPQPVVETAVDFINNLSFMFEEKSKNDSNSTNTYGEDATSFLMSVFEQKLTKVPSNSLASSNLAGSTPPIAIDAIQSKMPEAEPSNEAVGADATSEKFQQSNQQNVAIKSMSKVSDPFKEQPPQTVEKVIKEHPLVGLSGVIKMNSSDHSVNQNKKTASTTEPRLESSSLIGLKKERKKSLVEDDPTLSHPEDSSATLPSKIKQSFSKDKPPAKETPCPGTSASSSKRKEKEQPPQTIENVTNEHLSVRSSGVIETDSSVHLVQSPVNLNTETASETDHVVESILLGGLEKEKKSIDETNLTISHPKDSSPTLLSEIKQSSLKDKPLTEETPSPATSTASTRRKGRKSVPVLIAKLKQSRKTPVSAEKLPEQVDGVSKTEEKSSKKLEELTKLPSEPPPHQEHSRKMPVSPEQVDGVSKTEEKSSKKLEELTKLPSELPPHQQQSQKTPVSPEKLPEQVDGVSKTEEKSSKKLEELTKLPSELPPHQQQSQKTPVSPEKLPEQVDGVSKTEEKSSKKLEELTKLPSESPLHQQQSRKTPVFAEKQAEQVDGVSKTEEKSSKTLEEPSKLPGESPPHQPQSRKTPVSAEKLAEQVDGVSKTEEKSSKRLEELTKLPSEPPPHQQQSRKTLVSPEKLPEQVEGVSKTEEKSSKKLEELTKLPADPPPNQQQSSSENKTEKEVVISASTPKQSMRRRSTKTLPISIAKLNETRKPPEIKNKPPERVKNRKSPQKVDGSTKAIEEVQSEQTMVTEVIQKSLLVTTVSESQQQQTEACVPEHQGAPDDNIKKTVDRSSKSVDKSEENAIEIEMPGSTPKSPSQVKEVLIPKTRNTSTSKPAPELEKLSDEVASVAAIKTRQITERSIIATPEPDAMKSTVKEHEIEITTEPNVIVNTRIKQSKAPKETLIIKETVESVDSKAESNPDSNDLQIQTPSQTQDKKEQDVADSKSIGDISHTTTIMDSGCQSQSLNREKVSDVLEQKQLELEKSKEDAPLEKADVTSRRSSKGKSSAAVKSHSFGSTESLPAIEIAETSTRSRRSRARSKTEKATPNLKNTNESSTSERKQTRQSSEREEKVKTTTRKTRRSTTPNTRTISNKLDKTPDKETISQTNTKESEKPVEPIVNVIESPTSDHTTKGKGKVETLSAAVDVSIADATIKAANAGNEIPNTPAPVSTRKSRSKAKSSAGLSTEKSTKITNIVIEELSKQNASTRESNSVETSQTPAKPRSQRSTTAKVLKDKLNATTDGVLNTMSEDGNREKATKVDSLKEKTDSVPTTSKTRRRTRADSNKELPIASITTSAEAVCDPKTVSNPEVAKSKSDEPEKSRTSRRRKVSEREVTQCTISATDEIPQTTIDKSKSKETAPDTISPSESLQTQSIISGTRGKRKSKVCKDLSTTENDSQFDSLFHNLESKKDIVSPFENPSLATDDSSRISDDSHDFDSCDPDVGSLLAMVTTTNKTLKGDACHSTPKQSKSKSLLKKDKSQEKQVTVEKEETNFFGFNEKEIEEGQQSTSLRLSQSEEVVPVQASPQTGGKKKRSPTVKGKKQKTEQTNWKKNSSASLKNWLTTAVKSTERDDEQVQKQTNEINSSIPLKKRRARDQNLDEPIKLDENVKDLPEDDSKEDTPSNVGSSTVESNQGKISAPDDSEPSTKAKQRNRKPPTFKKGENEQIDLFKTPNETKRAKRKRSPVAEDTPSAEPAAKRSLLLPEMGQFSSERRKRGRPSALAGGAKPAYTPAVPVSPLKRKYKNDIEFNPRLLLITKKEEIKNDEPLNDPDKQTAPTSADDLQCALCLGYTPKKKWFQHVSNHYGVGWVVGTEPPLNVNSRSSVLNYMVEFFKNSRVKGLDCRICKRQRRSALGLLTHLEQCCLTEDELKESRVVCEHCHHEYSKSSIVIHLRTCPELLKKTKAEAKVDPKSVNSDGGVDSMLSNTGRLKRKSVIKAENKLKNLDDSEFIPDEVIKRIPPRRPDLYPSTWRLEIEAFGKGFCVEKKCPFTAPTVEELVEHSQIDVCPFMEKVGYKCMKCKFHSVEIEPCRLHVVEKHSPQPARDFECSDDDAQVGSESSSDSISSGVDENDEDGNTEQVEGEQKKHKRKKKTTKKRNRIKTHQSQKDFKKLLPDREFDIAYRVRRWYEKFINDHYSTNPLFDFATPSAIHTDNESFEMYLPKSPISMKFVLRGFEGFVKEFGKSKIAPEKWQTLERFQGKGLANEHAVYFGGPVKSIAWVPLEPHPASKTQYLAVVTRKEIDKFTRFSQPKHSRVLVYIQKYHLEESNVISGEMHYAFPIDAGPAHCLEFLPSGGYAPHMNRLGLVAVGTVATEIKIYSLPLEVEKKECDIFVIIRLEPSFELCLEIADSPSQYTGQYQSQCMSIAWSQTTGHNYVIGGYLNGFVAIWDVTEEDDNLNRFLVNGLRKFVPVTYFWTMDNRIKYVVPHYDVNGLRWLGICNHNRKILLYDLREITKPTLFYAETTKNVCNSLDWPIVWENPSCGHGDAMPSHGKCINTISPMSLVFVNRRFDKFCCGVNDISFNPWRNMYAGAGDNGDINVTPLREAILDVGLRMKIDEKAMSTLDIVSLDGSVVSKKLPDGVGLLEPDYKQKYGLVFGATKRIVASKNREVYSEKRIPPLNMARLTRVNRLRFNPNRSANCLLAVGYESGFVRVIQSDWHRTS